MKLSERALLVSLHIGAWGASKHDREVTEEVEDAHKAQEGSGRYTKFLMSKESLRGINSVSSIARRTHKVLTLPWEDNGSRIISTRAYQNYVETFRAIEIKHNRAVKDFLDNYKNHIEESKQRLQSLFDPEDYPPLKDVRSKFYIEVEPKPISEAGDFRAKVSSESAKAIAEDIERRSKQRLEEAMKSVWERVFAATEKMIVSLKKYEEAPIADKRLGKFNDTLVTNLQDLAELLPNLNVSGDPKIDKISKDLLADLCEHSATDLRKDAKARKLTSDKAKKILKKVSDYMA